MKSGVILLVAISLLLNQGCKKDTEVDDDETIRNYIADNGLTAEKTEEGVYYIITREGAGVSPSASSKVTVHYKGYLLNGNIFDSSYDREKTSTFSLSGVIRGWQIGIPKLKVGGAGTLLIPSHLAYGKNPPAGSIIGSNEVLAFDIELFEVE
ncbi:MAG: peptidylprolyl isomerase [Bacteroidetes bacterium]|nr:MAG: peptidylprolyl isomerase [Bacteroidota bacterium]